ncbi:MAG: type II toxin-antitoxin system VapB family antitoxin [Flammeovirgaceae bacterium]|nr:MAG: type II toxin-antitoxin system VapB family antitoxin [Flammeovirgaceae bacterium]
MTKQKMVRINVDIDDELMETGMRMSGAKTKKDLVNTALRYYRDLLLRQKSGERTKRRKDAY